MKDERLEISQPALDPGKSEVHHQITARGRRSKVHRLFFISSFSRYESVFKLEAICLINMGRGLFKVVSVGSNSWLISSSHDMANVFFYLKHLDTFDITLSGDIDCSVGLSFSSSILSLVNFMYFVLDKMC